MDGLEERIRAVLVEQLGVDPGGAAAATFDEMGLDSLGVIELVEIVQSEFGVQIADDALARVTGPGDIVALLRGSITAV